MLAPMTDLRWVTWLQRILVLTGVVAACWGVIRAANGATLPPAAPVQVPVTLDAAGYRYLDLAITGPAPQAEHVALARHSTFVLEATGATRLEHFLARGDGLLYGVGALVVALALGPLLTSIAQQRPFVRGNVRRLVVIAVTIAVCGVAAPLLPQHQGLKVLERTGLADLTEPAGRYFVLEPSIPWAPLLVAATVLAVAVAFRAGERLTADVEGLV
jgi:hypothetical protein